MCDIIIMPDETETESIREDGYCLCNSTYIEILTWIISHIPEVKIGQVLEIEHDPFGWIVRLKNKEER